MHPIENMMKTAMEQIKEMVDVNTIVGDAVFSQDGTIILPVSKVCFGFVAGGGEYAPENRVRYGKDEESSSGYPFAGGASAGISLKPLGFIVVTDGTVRLLPMENLCGMDRLLEIVPQAVTLIKELAETESCIILGRCGNFLLAGQPNVLRVFIHAPVEARVARVASYSLAWSQRVVAKHIRVEDHRRSAYYHYYTGEEWRDAAAYDLSLDSDALGEDGCVEMIRKALPLFLKS